MSKKKEEPKVEKERVGWHQILGTIIQEMLTPTAVTVTTDVPVLTEAPKADLLLLRRKGANWSKSQKAKLPDGIRDSSESHILIEFKATESINFRAVHQIEQYDYYFRRSQKLKTNQLKSFLVSSKTVYPNRLKLLEFEPSNIQGVYCGTSGYTENTTLIVANALRDLPHNVAFKLFASRNEERNKAFAYFRNRFFKRVSRPLEQTVLGLWRFIHLKGGFMGSKTEIAEAMEEWSREVFWRSIGEETAEAIVEKVGTEKLLENMEVEKIEAYLNELKSKKS